MRRLFFAFVGASLMCAGVLAGTIRFEAVKLEPAPGKMAPGGEDLYQITYMVDRFLFPANRELDIQFDPAVYAGLSTVDAPAGFDVLLLQPNNPPGTPGDLSALALIDFPDTSTEFSVIVRMTGLNRPGPQDFVINQLDEHGFILARILSGQTESDVPEPATTLVTITGFLAMSGVAAVRRVRKQSRS